MTESKNVLRDQARKHRARIEVFASDFENAADIFFKDFQPAPQSVISGYWPCGREFDPMMILEQACMKGYRCALPVVQPGTKILRFCPWTPSSPMKEGAYGVAVPEIQEEALLPDIVLVPLLAFDRQGYRLGQGGGYYDATLKNLRAQKNIQALGVAYTSQAVLFHLPVEEHDQKLDGIITPKESQMFI